MYRRLEYISTIIADLGDIFSFIAPLTCIPLLVAVIFREWEVLLAMAVVPLVFFWLGLALRRLPRNIREVRLSTGFCSVALFWLVCAIISGIPFMLALHMGFVDAVFEGMAGWTGTAFTLIPSQDTAPHTLLFWRSYMQWIGGIGIIAFTLALASSTGLFQARLFRTEGREEPLMPSIIATGKQIWKIYGFLTFIAIGIILFTGLSLWESVNLALSAISTGGFTLHPDGVGYYHSILLELLLIPIMIAGALPYKLYYQIKEKRKWSLFDDDQIKLFLLILAAGTLVVSYDLIFFGNQETPLALEQGLFMTVSAMTTTGFQISNPHAWASVTLIIVAMIMFIGGSYGSTAGGIKLSRIALAFRALAWWFRRLFVSGRVIIPFRMEGRIIPRATAELESAKNMLVIILSVIVVVASTLVILQFHLTSFSFSEVTFEVVSAFSTCGITTGYVSPDMPVISKLVFIVVMWLGRLEVIPVIMLAVAFLRGPD